MKRYELISERSNIIVELHYEKQLLQAVIFKGGNARPEYFLFVVKNMETEVKMLTAARHYGYSVELLESGQVTFEDFWERYGYKVDKKRALDKWKKLKPAEQRRAVEYISKYKNELRRTGVAQMYPKTYLQNKIWEE